QHLEGVVTTRLALHFRDTRPERRYDLPDIESWLVWCCHSHTMVPGFTPRFLMHKLVHNGLFKLFSVPFSAAKPLKKGGFCKEPRVGCHPTREIRNRLLWQMMRVASAQIATFNRDYCLSFAGVLRGCRRITAERNRNRPRSNDSQVSPEPFGS